MAKTVKQDAKNHVLRCKRRLLAVLKAVFCIALGHALLLYGPYTAARKAWFEISDGHFLIDIM